MKESYRNIHGKIISTTDFGLTEKGVQQAKCVGEKINTILDKKVPFAYCSPLVRTKETLLEILRCIHQENIAITESR